VVESKQTNIPIIKLIIATSGLGRCHSPHRAGDLRTVGGVQGGAVYLLLEILIDGEKCARCEKEKNVLCNPDFLNVQLSVYVIALLFKKSESIGAYTTLYK
jgi:hypothetical protein